MFHSNLYKSKSWMYRKYKVLRMTEKEIAIEANTSQATINRWLKIHGLKD